MRRVDGGLPLGVPGSTVQHLGLCWNASVPKRRVCAKSGIRTNSIILLPITVVCGKRKTACDESREEKLAMSLTASIGVVLTVH